MPVYVYEHAKLLAAHNKQKYGKKIASINWIFISDFYAFGKIQNNIDF